MEPSGKGKPAIPAWQNASPSDEPGSPAKAAEPIVATDPVTIEQARKFLEDDAVRNESRERKAEFLKSKGVAPGDIEKLFEEDAQKQAQQSLMQAEKDMSPRASETIAQTQATATDASSTEKHDDRPPIVTYPEFLMKPVKPPPLMTAKGFLNTLSGFVGLSLLTYGASKYMLEPMVAALTDARISLHETAKEDVNKLVDKLEGTVSEIPSYAKKSDGASHHTEGGGDDDDQSSYGDPSEMFHRDIGVQTSPPLSPRSAAAGTASKEDETATARQTRQLTELVASVREVTGGFTAQSEDHADIKRRLDVFKEDLDKLTYPPGDFVGAFSLYANAGKNEPDDEIKKAKENIRRIKGVMLSARSFPSSVR